MDDELDAAAREVNRLAAQAQAELMRLIQVSGTLLTVQQVKTIQQQFNAAFVDVMVARLNSVPQGDVWDVRMVKAMKVGDVSLSQRLYANAQQTSQHVAALVKEHAQGKMQARELAIRLYDGYDPKDGIVRPLEGVARAKLPKALKQLTANPVDRASLQQVFEQGQRYAQALKTEPLKAAYLQALKAWERDKGAAALERAMEIAHKEKTRYMANRIAQTELARAHQHALADTLMADDTISVVQVQMSASHPMADVCDLHSKADLWGLGPGCYPKEKAPKPVYHPFCRCRLRSRPSLQAAMAREKPSGEAAYLRSLPINEAVKVAGSRTRLQQILNGENFDDVVNAGRDSMYRLSRLGGMPHSKSPTIAEIEAMPFGLARESVMKIVKSGDFLAFSKGNMPGEFPVAVVTPAVQMALGSSVKTVRFSGDDRNKQVRKDSELGRTRYELVQSMIDSGEIVKYRDRAISMYQQDGVWYHAAIQVTKAGDELYLKSLRRANDQQRLRDRAIGVLIQKGSAG